MNTYLIILEKLINTLKNNISDHILYTDNYSHELISLIIYLHEEININILYDLSKQHSCNLTKDSLILTENGYKFLFSLVTLDNKPTLQLNITKPSSFMFLNKNYSIDIKEYNTLVKDLKNLLKKYF